LALDTVKEASKSRSLTSGNVGWTHFIGKMDDYDDDDGCEEKASTTISSNLQTPLQLAKEWRRLHHNSMPAMRSTNNHIIKIDYNIEEEVEEEDYNDFLAFATSTRSSS